MAVYTLASAENGNISIGVEYEDSGSHYATRIHIRNATEYRPMIDVRIPNPNNPDAPIELLDVVEIPRGGRIYTRQLPKNRFPVVIDAEGVPIFGFEVHLRVPQG